MKKTSEKEGEKLSQKNIPPIMRCRSKAVASGEDVEDANNGEVSLRTLEDDMTPSELSMSLVDSILQHEYARLL